MAADISQRIALALQGFGAGVQGQGPYFEHMLNQQGQQLSESRKMAGIQDAYSVMRNLQAGNIPTARKTLINRLGLIKQLGGDPADTMELLQQIDSGNVEAALNEVSSVVNYAQAVGMLKLPQNAQPKTQVNTKTGQVFTTDPITNEVSVSTAKGFIPPEQPKPELRTVVKDGQVIAIDPTTAESFALPITGFKKDRTDLMLRARDQQLRERQLQLQEQSEARQANKLSAGLEKVLLDSQDAAVNSARKSTKFETLANDFERLKIEGGLKSSLNENLKAMLGTQDAVTEFKRQANEVRMSEAVKLLPPGAASDADVKLALSTQPKENASPEQISSYLRGAAKIARFEAGFHQFKSDFISKQSTGKGLNQAWRAKVAAPALKREVSIAEIYETAQNRGTTPEDVMNQLGIKGLPY